MMRNISYSSEAFGDMDEMEARFRHVTRGIEFDTIIGTGLSGSMVVPDLARRLDKNFAIIRKPSDSSHAEEAFEGVIGDKWIFVDDFISTGKTLARVVNTVALIERRHNMKYLPSGHSHTESHTEFVGCWEYHRANGFRSAGSLVGDIEYGNRYLNLNM